MKTPISEKDIEFFKKVIGLVELKRLPPAQICESYNISLKHFEHLILEYPELKCQLDDLRLLESNNLGYEGLVNKGQSGLAYNLAPQIERTETIEYDANGDMIKRVITTRTVPPNMIAVKFALTKLNPDLYGNNTKSVIDTAEVYNE